MKAAIAKAKKPAAATYMNAKPKKVVDGSEEALAKGSTIYTATPHLSAEDYQKQKLVAAEKRLLELEVKPKINLALKL